VKLDLSRLETLNTKRLGRQILFSRKVESTSKLAKKLANYGAGEGTVVVAETQTCGRGRLGRQWVSPSGGLWFSVILRPVLRAGDAAKLVFVASLAVAKVLKENYGLNSQTKWPNDVMLNGRKVCGVLAEMNTTGNAIDFVVVGVGINVNFDVDKTLPEELREVTTSLRAEVGKVVSLSGLFKLLLETFECLYDQLTSEGFDSILEEWKRFASFLGHNVEVNCQKEKQRGLALDVDQEGALVLKLYDGTVRHLLAGDVSLINN
jgi:biotin-[acetyl-CoA-carboxylase] ligase BirA-like protein